MNQCKAKSKRTGVQCQSWAVNGRTTCRMHGGTAKGPRTKNGKKRSRLAVLKHGGFTKKAKAEYQEAMELIRQSKDFLRSL